MSIWQELAKPIYILAPMEAVTDHVFRRVVTEAESPDLFFTEFANATGWVNAGEKAISGRLTLHSDERTPVIAQIWGTKPSDISALAIECRDRGFAGIDINMGCPEKSAIKSGGGAAMCNTPELASEIIAAAKAAGLPVSVKCRLGYSRLEEWESWITHLLKQDIAALTVHLRTKKEMSKTPAHWELMPLIKQVRDVTAPNTVLIGNGDVPDRSEGERLVGKYGIDGVMIGRGIFHNPFCFEENPKDRSREELLDLLKLHLKLFEELTAQQETNGIRPKPYETIKRFFKIYIRDFPGSNELRTRLMNTSSISEATKIIDEQI